MQHGYFSFCMKSLLLLTSAVIKEKYVISVISNLLVLEIIFSLEFSGRLGSKLKDSENS